MTVWALLAACSGDSSGAALNLDYLSGTDVEGFHFRVERVACTAADAFTPRVVEGNIALVDGIFPAQITWVDDAPFAADSRHTGGEMFLALEPGCYDLVFTPASFVDQGSWLSSNDCGEADVDGVVVDAGRTTEVLLISQCQGGGSTTVPSTGNRAPIITVPPDDLSTFECEAATTCFTVYDPDDDLLTVDWDLTSTRPLFALDVAQPVLLGFEEGHRLWEVCAEVVGEVTDDYALALSVTDPAGLSDDAWHDLDVAWIDDPYCFDAFSGLQPDGPSPIDRVAGCEPTTAEQWYCSGNYGANPVTTAAVCLGTDLQPELLYPSCGGFGGGGPE